MEAKDLMIGDWVSLLGTHHYKVKEIKYVYGVYKIFFQGTYSYALEDEIVPIPLTPEILEKNGWDFDEIDGDFRGCNGKFYIYGRYYPYSIFDGVQISYVHELQHALRLCGIEKEIVL